MFRFGGDNFWTKLKCFGSILSFLMKKIRPALAEIISGPNWNVWLWSISFRLNINALLFTVTVISEPNRNVLLSKRKIWEQIKTFWFFFILSFYIEPFVLSFLYRWHYWATTLVNTEQYNQHIHFLSTDLIGKASQAHEHIQGQAKFLLKSVPISIIKSFCSC